MKNHLKVGTVILIATIFLAGCNQKETGSSDAAAKAKSSKLAKQKKYDEGIQAKVQNGTYSFAKTQDWIHPYHMKTSAGIFSLAEPEITFSTDSTGKKLTEQGFQVSFVYKNTTKKPQDGIKVLQSLMKVQELKILGTKSSASRINFYRVTAPYNGMDQNVHDSQVREIANNGKMTQPGETINQIVGVIEPVKKPRSHFMNPMQARVTFYADPKSKVELKTTKMNIVLRFD
ncbi:hypothetical protein [Xylocopilactobacillus apis]|uniref:DUF5067 domain-containing protein n=1 Tax=Xylocopilactobacillus apis TaxID=2932183 RepID=A0AAU9D460_9LACO|nr:hypothetical protein [Xylocopilactobacillus apis]BDR57125.1 hypothetical protein KIMC2_16870 [Xylocopilactobacillus apis]